jgi:HTH-type transcriptional regulator/antitoxin HigA
MTMDANRPIRTDGEYAEAIAEVRRLWGAEADTSQGNRLDLLLVLVSAYEEERFQIDPPDPIDAILERLNNRDMSRTDLEALLGVSSGRVSEILNRRRHLTLDMIRKLATGLGLSEHCLVQPYELARQYA